MTGTMQSRWKICFIMHANPGIGQTPWGTWRLEGLYYSLFGRNMLAVPPLDRGKLPQPKTIGVDSCYVICCRMRCRGRSGGASGIAVPCRRCGACGSRRTYEWQACNSTLAFAVDNLTLESGGAHSVKITKVEDYGTIKVITETQEKNGVSGVYKKSWAAPGGKPIPASAVYRKKTQ